MISKVSAHRVPFIVSSTSTVGTVVVVVILRPAASTVSEVRLADCRNFRDLASRRKNLSLSFPFSRARLGFPLACETLLSVRDAKNTTDGFPI